MELISNICSILIVMATLAVPVLFIIFIIRWCMRKSKKWIGFAAAICAGSIVPLALIGTFTDPSTYCEHEYSVVEEVDPTCTKRGKIVRECSLCERRSTERIDKVDHAWETFVVSATCTEDGYITERCVVCDKTKKIDGESALGHDMKEAGRKEPTQDSEGEIVYQCSRCGEKDVEVIEKLPKPTETNPPTETTKAVEPTEVPTTALTETPATEPTETNPPTEPTTQPSESTETTYSPETEVSSEAEMVLMRMAEDIAKQIANYPATVDFNTFAWGFWRNDNVYAVQGTFTCTNAFGVPGEHTIKLVCLANDDYSKISVKEVYLDGELIKSA